jgi:hypothetical protein
LWSTMIPFPNISLDILKPWCHLIFSSDSGESLTCCLVLGHPLHLVSSNRQKVIHKTFNQNLFECNICVVIATHESQFEYAQATPGQSADANCQSERTSTCRRTIKTSKLYNQQNTMLFVSHYNRQVLKK